MATASLAFRFTVLPSASPPVPELARFRANMLTYGKQHADWMRENKSKAFDPALAATYYDAARVYYNIADDTGDAIWLAAVSDAVYVYRDRYVLPNNGNVPGYWNFGRGLAEHFRRTGDVKSRNAVYAMADTASYSRDWESPNLLTSYEVSREVAYALLTRLEAESIGKAHSARTDLLYTKALGHIDQWTGGATGYIQPFMVGITCEALIAYHAATGDARALPAVQRALDLIWTLAWREADGGFYYESTAPDRGAPDLNMLIAPAFGWVYRQTGDVVYTLSLHVVYRDRGDKVFAGDGTAVTSGTLTISKDGTEASSAGTLTHISGGAFKYTPTQGETDCEIMGFVLEGTGAIPVCGSIRTTACDPNDSVRLGLTSLPNAAAGASGGLPTGDGSGRVQVQYGTSTGQINLSAGNLAGTVTLAATTHTGAVIPTVTTLTNDPTGVGTLLTRLGTPSNLGGGATISANLADIEAQTDDIGAAGAGLTGIPWNAAWDAEVQSEVEDALVVHRLDELLNADSDIDGAAPPTVGSVFHELMSKTTGSFTFDQTTDSLEALRDRGDAAWITATGFSTLSQADIRTAVGLASANLDAQLTAIDDYIDTEIAAIYSRIGAPAGASIAADIAAIKAETASILDDTGTSGVVVASGSKTGYTLTTAGYEAAADALLNRNVAGGSNSGRLVKEALYLLRNKWDVASGTLTVYATDDTTTAWQASVSAATGGDPIKTVDPS